MTVTNLDKALAFLSCKMGGFVNLICPKYGNTNPVRDLMWVKNLGKAQNRALRYGICQYDFDDRDIAYDGTFASFLDKHIVCLRNAYG